MNQLTKPSTLPQTLEGQKAEEMRLSRELSDRAGNDELVQAAEMLIAPYPHARPADPAGYVRTMVAHLAKYPRFVLERIVDPANGVVTQCVFPPVIAEIEKFATPIWNEATRKLQSARETVKQISPPHEPEISEAEREANFARLKALSKQIAANLDMSKPKRKPDPRSHCKSGEAIRKHMGLEPVTGEG